MSVVAVDVGGTTIKGARVSASGAIEQRHVVETPRLGVSVAIAGVASALLTPDVTAAGVVVPGAVDRGVVHYAANVPDLRDADLRGELTRELGIAVAVGHDVAAAAEAEAALVGSDLLFVSVGTGIAAVSVRDGIAERGASGRAGEIGHIPVVPYGVDCGCGGRGCAEAYASAASIGRRWRAVSGYPSGDAEQVVALLRSDPRAATVWSTAVNALAAAIVAAVCVLDPPLIVLGGGLSRAGDALLVPLRTALWFSWRPEPPIHLSRLGVDAGVLGAARLAQRAAHELVKEST